MRSHILSAYRDHNLHKWMPYCAKCSLEGDELDREPICVGRYVSPLTDQKIKKMEERIDNLKSVF